MDYILNNKETKYDLNEHVFSEFRNKDKINVILEKNKLQFDIEKLSEFTSKMFYYREQIKYQISKVIMCIYECLGEKAKELGITLEEISFISVVDVLKNWNNSEEIKRIIKENWYKYNEECKLCFPDIINSEKEFYDFIIAKHVPNFITGNSVNAPIVILDKDTKFENLEGKILLIEKADPGYDWVFNCGIVGLITQYGGVASHMSLRAHELMIPAAIGCGSELFNQIKKGQEILLQCGRQKIYRDGECIYY